MRVEARETGSICVSARKERVIEVLRSHVRGAAMRGDRIEAPGHTYVVHERADGTHVFHARRGSLRLTALREREALRHAVQADLYELRRILEVNPR